MDSSEEKLPPNRPPRSLFEELRTQLRGRSRNYVTITELASLIGVDYRTLRRKVVSGGIEAVQIRGRYRIYEDAIKKFLEEEGFTLERGEPTV